MADTLGPYKPLNIWGTNKVYNFADDYNVLLCGEYKPAGKIVYCYFTGRGEKPLFKIGVVKHDGSFV